MAALEALGQLCTHFGPLMTHAFMLCAAVPSTHDAQAIVSKNDFLWQGSSISDAVALRRATERMDEAKRLLERGDRVTAAICLFDTIDLRVRVRGERHPDVALALHELARVRLAQGDSERAAVSMRSAMDILEDQVGLENPMAMAPMFTMVRTRLAQGNIAGSLWWMNRVLREQEDDDEPFGALGETEEVRTRAQISDQTMDAALTLHLVHARHDPEAAKLAFSAVFRRKERVFEARMQALSALRRLGSKGRELANDLQTAQSRLAKVIVQGPGNLPLSEYRARVTAMDDARKDLEMQLVPRSLSGYLADPHPDIEVVRNALPERSALVEFMLYRRTLNGQDPKAKEPRYAAYVLTKTEGPLFIDLGPVMHTDHLITYLRHDLSDPRRDPIPLARTLGDRVMAPIVRLIGNATRLLVAPDGNLSFLPLGALRDENGWYMDRFEFTYLSTGRELIRSGTNRAPRQNPVIIAAPNFDHAALPEHALAATRGVRRQVDFGDVRFPPLGHAEAEAREIHALMPWTKVFIGAEASEVLVKQLQGPEILHLATHGFYLRNAPKPQAKRGSAVPDVWEDGFLRGGLAFAGANQRENEQEDGVLTALEASALDLEGTKLVVLSGCETGIGEVQARDGVRGLRHAFLMAGAQTLVTSLWPVDDEATRQLMVSYYEALIVGQGRSEALRTAAQKTMRASGTSHPYAWAGFIVLGNGSRLDGTWSTLWDEPTIIEPVKFPPVEVLRGPRGCMCDVAGEDATDGGVGAGVFLVAAWIKGRRRGGTRRLHERRKGVTGR